MIGLHARRSVTVLVIAGSTLSAVAVGQPPSITPLVEASPPATDSPRDAAGDSLTEDDSASTAHEAPLVDDAVQVVAVEDDVEDFDEDVDEDVDEGDAVVVAAPNRGLGAPDHRMMVVREREIGDPSLADREVPDYDAREDARPSASGRLLWIPRVLFFPAWVVTELVLRRPLGALTRAIEGGGGGSNFDPLRFFILDDGNLQIIPTLLIDFGNQPSVGFYIRWNEVGHQNHHMRLHFAFWGPDWVKGRFTTRWEPPSNDQRAELRVSATRRGDGRYAGLGSNADPDRPARYSFRQIEVLGSYEIEPWRQSKFELAAGMLEEKYGNEPFCCPTIEERVAEGAFNRLPPGYPDGFLVGHVDTDLQVDTRRDRGEGSSGVSARFHSRYAFDLEDPGARRWFRYGGSLGLHWDITGDAHILSLVASAAVAKAIRGEVPFTELVELSGPGPLRGFRQGSLRGDSGAALTMLYQWPVWVWLDARAHVTFGNVYDGQFSGFSLDSQRMSFGIGLGAVDELDHYFHFTLGWGTEPLGQGLQVQTFRLAVGAEWEL